MPVHDWTRVSAGTFHNFHCRWQSAICDALNGGLLPPGYFAMVEQRAGGPIPDVLAIELPPPTPSVSDSVAIATPPKTRFIVRSDTAVYARKARKITIRDELGEVVSIIEIVSPGNKDTENSLQTFTKKMADFLLRGVSLVVVDVFPPSERDPHGIHKAIWDNIHDDDFALPSGQPLTAAGYCAETLTAYIEPFAVNEVIPNVPLFLRGERYIECPLEATYAETWAVMPVPIRRLFEPA
jgi:hypothetical protein